MAIDDNTCTTLIVDITYEQPSIINKSMPELVLNAKYMG
jgi:hypothetical protein